MKKKKFSFTIFCDFLDFLIDLLEPFFRDIMYLPLFHYHNLYILTNHFVNSTLVLTSNAKFLTAPSILTNSATVCIFTLKNKRSQKVKLIVTLIIMKKNVVKGILDHFFLNFIKNKRGLRNTTSLGLILAGFLIENH